MTCSFPFSRAVFGATTLFCLLAIGCSCSKKPNGKKQDAGLDARADADADASQGDAGPDAARDASAADAGPVDAFVYHDCMAPLEVEEITAGELYQIPVVEQDFHGGFGWNGRYLVQADYRCPGELHLSQDLYVIDMQTMEEELIVARGWGQTSPSLQDDNFVYTDFSYFVENDPNSNHRAELILHNLLTHEETRLTDSNHGKATPRFNGSHVVFIHYEQVYPVTEGATLRLLDIATSEETVLATEEQGITSSNIWAINTEYVAWRAVPEGEPSGAWDVFLHHIPTAQTSRLHTPTDSIFNVRLSSDKILWTERRNGYWGVYARDLETMTEQIVASGSSDKVLGTVGANVVSWQDYERSGCSFPCSVLDIVAKDLETGVQRRLTEEPGRWGLNVSECPWALRRESDSSSSFRLYLWDMIAAGVLDQNCHLIACDPDTEPCAMLEWQGP